MRNETLYRAGVKNKFRLPQKHIRVLGMKGIVFRGLYREISETTTAAKRCARGGDNNAEIRRCR